MYDSIAAPETSAIPDETGARERMRLVRTLSEIGVRIAERMDRQSELSAIYAETCAVPEHLHAPYARRIDEIGRAFAQVCRAVTLAVALEERIETDLHAGPDARAEQALKRRLLAARAAAAEAPAPAATDTRPAPETPRAPDTRLRLDRALDPGLNALDAALDRNPDELIAQVRKGLGLGEDLAQWEAPDPASTAVKPGRMRRADRRRARVAAAAGPILNPPRAAHAAAPP
jgi:hypothetical protein